MGDLRLCRVGVHEMFLGVNEGAAFVANQWIFFSICSRIESWDVFVLKFNKVNIRCILACSTI